MKNLFAEYRPEGRGRQLEELEVVIAEERDVAALARLAARREALPLKEVEPRFLHEVQLVSDAHRLWVARTGGEAIAFARASYTERPAECPPNHQPAGWYLTGVIVDEDWRRRGVARELTRARMEFVAQRAREAFYIASAMNHTSIDLHAGFGFEELTRDFFAPRVTSFTGGVGILFRARL
jgi:ribosomal protein S18 acetylase RimI-like enzyme